MSNTPSEVLAAFTALRGRSLYDAIKIGSGSSVDSATVEALEFFEKGRGSTGSGFSGKKHGGATNVLADGLPDALIFHADELLIEVRSVDPGAGTGAAADDLAKFAGASPVLQYTDETIEEWRDGLPLEFFAGGARFEGRDDVGTFKREPMFAARMKLPKGARFVVRGRLNPRFRIALDPDASLNLAGGLFVRLTLLGAVDRARD